MDEAEDEIVALYKRFSREIAVVGARPYFDEDDLVDIYDYANDNHDEYVKLEVLMCGARLCPGSLALAERKAFYYYDLGEFSAVQSIILKLPNKSFLRELLDIRLNVLNRDEAGRRLEYLLKKVRDSRLEDEEVIQLMHIAGDMDLIPWLKSNYELIKQKARFSETVLYELSDIMSECGDYEFARLLLEELTMESPFNDNFWELLAEINFSYFNDYEKTLNAVSYALAINPSSKAARLLKVRALCLSEHKLDEFKSIIESLLSDYSSDGYVVRQCALVLASRDDVEYALNILCKFNEDNPCDKDVIDALLVLMDGLVPDKILTRYFECVDVPEDICVDWADEYINNGSVNAASAILNTFYSFHDDMQNFDKLLELLYEAGKDQDVIDRFESRYPDGRIVANVDTVIAMKMGLTYALACKRIGKICGLSAKIKSYMDMRDEKSENISSAAMSAGCYHYLSQLLAISEGDK